MILRPRPDITRPTEMRSRASSSAAAIFAVLEAGRAAIVNAFMHDQQVRELAKLVPSRRLSADELADGARFAASLGWAPGQYDRNTELVIEMSAALAAWRARS